MSIHDQAIWEDGKLLFKQDASAESEVFWDQAYRALGLSYPKYFKVDELGKCGILAASRFETTSSTDMATVGMVLANANSSMASDWRFQQTIQVEEAYFPSPAMFVYTLPNIVIGEVCIYKGWQGENMFLVMPKLDAEQLFELATWLFSHTDQTACMLGWVESWSGCTEAYFVWLLKEARLGTATFTLQGLTDICNHKGS